MGMYNQTCALTRVPIFENDKCAVIVIKEDTKDINGGNFYYRCLTQLSPATFLSVVTHIYEGNYNHYGWLWGVEKPYEDCHKFSIFIKQVVWDALSPQKSYVPTADYYAGVLDKYESYLNVPKDKMLHFLNVHNFALCVNTDLTKSIPGRQEELLTAYLKLQALQSLALSEWLSEGGYA